MTAKKAFEDWARRNHIGRESWYILFPVWKAAAKWADRRHALSIEP